jgi:hypothetical protein
MNSTILDTRQLKWDSGAIWARLFVRAVAVRDEHVKSIRTIPAMAHNCASPINLTKHGHRLQVFSL